MGANRYGRGLFGEDPYFSQAQKDSYTRGKAGAAGSAHPTSALASGATDVAQSGAGASAGPVLPIMVTGVNGAIAQLRGGVQMLDGGSAAVPLAVSTIQASIMTLEGVASLANQAICDGSGQPSGHAERDDPYAHTARKRPRYCHTLRVRSWFVPAHRPGPY